MAMERFATAFAVFAFLTIIAGCKPPVQQAESDVSQELTTDEEGEQGIFFKNYYERRDATESEAATVVHVGGCTGFFVKNSKGKIYIGSAKHCMSNRDDRTWCKTGTVKTNAGEVGKCVRVVASTPDGSVDITLFEVQFDPKVQENVLRTSKHLRLAATPPKKKTQLKMIGYPADKTRKAKLTVTENCWILKASAEPPYTHSADKDATHNCTTYGGNSGGPMIKKGTNIVIGEPHSYHREKDPRKILNASGNQGAAYVTLMSHFVALFKNTLVQNGVSIAD